MFRQSYRGLLKCAPNIHLIMHVGELINVTCSSDVGLTEIAQVLVGIVIYIIVIYNNYFLRYLLKVHF